MSVKNYYSFGGEILAEETGGVRRDYLTDAHGSVTATVTGAGAIENTYRYKPYGETLAKTGAASDPKFLWSGTWGYRGGSAAGTVYVRARTYHQGTARWTGVDPIRSGYNWYVYCSNNPVSRIDPMGLEDFKIPVNIPPQFRLDDTLAIIADMNSGHQSFRPSIGPFDDVYIPAWSEGGDLGKLVWFAGQVGKGCPWDFKRFGKKRQYEDFGNFHYGLAGAASGYSLELLLRAAGVAQWMDHTSKPEYGYPWGKPPYGDDPKDQDWIRMGWKFYNECIKIKGWEYCNKFLKLNHSTKK